jgi:vitamin B12 transporter
MSLRIVRWLLCASCLIWSIPSHAADPKTAPADQPEILETPEVVVSATKTPVPITQVTSAVEVITGEQMQQPLGTGALSQSKRRFRYNRRR